MTPTSQHNRALELLELCESVGRTQTTLLETRLDAGMQRPRHLVGPRGTGFLPQLYEGLKVPGVGFNLCGLRLRVQGEGS